LQWNAARYFDTGLAQAVELRRIIGQEPHTRAAEDLQHARRDPVVALIIVEAERRIGIDGIEPGVLKPIGAHLVGEPQSATFLLKIENDSAAQFFQPAQRQPELVTAI